MRVLDYPPEQGPLSRIVKRAAGSRIWGYILALVATAGAALVRGVLDPFLGDMEHYQLFFISVVLVAALAGLGPGLAAMSIGGAAGFLLFVYMPGRFRPHAAQDYIQLLLYIGVSSFIIWLASWARYERETATHRADELSEMLKIQEMANIMVCGLDDVIQRWSVGCQRMYGFTNDEAVGRSASELLRTHFAQPIDEIHTTLMQTGRWEGELIQRRSDGQDIIVSSEWSLSRDRAGVPVAVLKVNTDITGRKESERALAASESRFRAFFDNPAIGTAQITVPDGRFIEINQRYCDITGYSREELLTMTPADLSVPEQKERDWAQLKRFLDGFSPTHDVEKQYLRKDGKIIWVHVATGMICDETGKPKISAGVIEDITEQKLTEEALRNAYRRKDEFLAMLGHELRNPLTPIRNAAFLLKHVGSDNPVVHRAQEIIDRQVTHLSRLIDDLLDLSRISRGKIQLKKESVDITSIVRTFAQDYKPAIESGGLELNLCIPEHPLWVFGDPARIQQVVGNLLNNSVKFTDWGGKITLSVVEDSERVVIVVEDTGIGMAPDVLARIFQPFSQEQSSVHRSRGGLGLGLALVKGLAELHGGSVHAESPGIGGGSRFVVRLPMEKKVAAVKSMPQPSNETRAGRRILIVEDNFDSAESMQMLLSILGHEVLIAHSGVEALCRIHEFGPEVVLCDIGLPGEMDGYDVARAIRGDSKISSTFLIAMTGYGTEEDRRRAHDAGFDRHLTKPADLDEVARTLAS